MGHLFWPAEKNYQQKRKSVLQQCQATQIVQETEICWPMSLDAVDDKFKFASI